MRLTTRPDDQVGPVAVGPRRRTLTVPDPSPWWLLLRSTSAVPIICGCVVGTASVVAQAALTDGTLDVHIAAAVITTTAGVGFVLDDPAAEVLGASPVPLRRRNAARLGLAAAVVVTAWLAIWVAAAANNPSSRFPARDLGVEVAALFAAGAATSAFARRRGAAGGPAGALVVVLGPLVLSGLSVRFPRWFPILMPETNLHSRWLWIALVAMVVIGVATRDPAAPRAHRPGRIAVDG